MQKRPSWIDVEVSGVIFLLFNVAPLPLRAANSSSCEGSKISPNFNSPSTMNAMETHHMEMPLTNGAVPSMGSTTQMPCPG